MPNQIANFTPSAMPFRDKNAPVIDINFNGLNTVIRSHSDRISFLSAIINAIPGSPKPANPTATIGLAAINGTAVTYMRSDAAPALSQAIVPTWTGVHTFTQTIVGSISGSAGGDVILAPATAGRNLVQPTSLVAEGLVLKSFSSPVSILATGNWTTQGGGLIFGSDIHQDTSAASDTSYAYCPVSNLGGLVVTCAYSFIESGLSGYSSNVTINGIGICNRNINTSISPRLQLNSAVGAWCFKGISGFTYQFIGTNNSSVWADSSVVPGTRYSAQAIISVGQDNGGNKYNLTIRTIVPALGIDHTEIIIDGVDNATTGQNGFIAIVGNGNASVTGDYIITSITSGPVPSARAFETRTSGGVQTGYVDWDGSALFSSATIGSLGGVLKASFGVISGSATTSDLPEGTNLYYTDARARAAITGTTNRITVTTGVVDISAAYVGQTSLTTLGTIGTGVWQGTSVSTTYTDAKIKTVTGTANRLTIGGTATDPTFDVSTSYIGQATITTLGTIASGVWNGTILTVTYGGTGVATLASNGVLYGNGTSSVLALAVNSTATNKFLAQSFSGAPAWAALVSGDLPTIALTGDVTGSATSGSIATTIGANKVADTMIRQSSGLSVIGRGANTTGNVADITGSDGQVFRVSGTALGFGTIVAAGIASDAVTTIKILNSNVTLAKIANIADQTILGNNTGGSAAPVALTASQTRTVMGLATGDSPTLTGLSLSGLSASVPVFTNGSKALISGTQTGTGTNVVVSVSPTLTGTLTAAIANFSDNVTITDAGETGIAYIHDGTSGVLRNLFIAKSSGVSRCILRINASNNFVLNARNNTTGASIDNPISVALDAGGVITLSRNVSGLVTTGATTTDQITISSTNMLYISSTTGLKQIQLNSAGSNYGAIQNDAADTWSLGYGPNNSTALGTSVLKWNSSAVITASADIKIGTVGKGFYIKEGTNATMGTATLVLGTATVNTNKVTANSRIFLSTESLGTITAPVAVSVTGRSAGTSFTITSANLTDTSVIAWVILEPA